MGWDDSRAAEKGKLFVTVGDGRGRIDAVYRHAQPQK